MMAIEQPTARVVVKCDEAPCKEMIIILPESAMSESALIKLVEQNGWQVTRSKAAYCSRHKNADKK